MNIFIIARGYPSKQDPTWGCFEKDQAEALNSLGHQVTILSVDTRFRFYWRKLGIQCAMHNNIATFNIFLMPYALLFFLPKKIKEWFYAWQLEILYKRATLQNGTPDVIYSHYLNNTLKAIPLRKKHNIPIVAMEHWSQMAYSPIPKNTISTAKRVYASIDQLLTVSSALKNNIEQQIGVDSIVVPNMVGKEFHYAKQNKTERKTIQLITTGRLIPEKHFDMLIQAIANISSLPLKLIIIGNGSEKNRLKNLVNELQLENKVQLIGHKSKQEIVALLQKSDIFVLPSQSETFGVAYIEALACGLPIIATDCGGPRDFVNNNNGLLIPKNNQQAIEQAIIQMSNNLSLYDNKAIAEDCQNRFASNNVAKLITQILEQTIKAKP
ncbi:MAG: glycosyltransferase [Paludibacteraceae bacterium]|nr:glycosyltransferase [Paludibacteraceae bacterium]